MQPRLSSSSGEKTSDEIVFELAGNILNKIPDKLDIDKALPEMFEVSILQAVHRDMQSCRPARRQ